MRKAEYFSKDFDWDELRVQVENDPSFSYHLLPFQPNPISISLADEAHYAAAGSHAWNAFHHRHASGKFFKERRYLLEEFPELVNCKENSKVLEVGCGNGSTVLPILRGNENIIVYACDCSNEALERVKETIFTLSALPLHRMPESIKECFSVLEPGGMLFFRDYGLYDMSMLRFEMDKRVGFREYMRSDGTRSYFFCLDSVRNLFVGAGFTELELEYCCVKSVNRQNGKSMRRVWVHGKFQKPV